MAKLFVIFIVFVNCIIVDKACVPSVKPATTTQLWGYDDTDGPATWPGVCQTGTRQSPINIDIDDVQNDSNLAPLQFGNYEYYGNATFDDNGHTEIAENFISSVAAPYIEGGGLDGRYVFSQFHFHWPSSEHTIEDLHYPLEAHFVHYLQGLTSAQALVTPNGIAVVAVLFQICNQSDALQTLSNVFSVTEQYDSNTTITYRPSDLLPMNTNSFYRYQGSLTTPDCNEVVVWTVMAQPICVQEEEINGLQQLTGENGNLLTRNYRPVQPTNGREVIFRP